MATFFYKNSKGKRVCRCTSIINLLGYNKNFLMRWALEKGDKAKTIQKDACDIGTFIHELIEAFIKNKDYNEMLKSAPFEFMVVGQTALDNFKKWFDVVKPEFVEIEYTIISELRNWGGTADFIARIPQEVEYNGVLYKPGLYLGDFKTSKSVYREHLVQMSGYIQGVQEIVNMDHKTKEDIIRNNSENPYLKNLSLNPYPDLKNETILIHINKDVTKESEEVIKPYIIPADIMDMAREDWEIALAMNERKNIFNKFFKSLK